MTLADLGALRTTAVSVLMLKTVGRAIVEEKGWEVGRGPTEKGDKLAPFSLLWSPKKVD